MLGKPKHPFAAGIIVIESIIGTAEELTAVNVGTSPIPAVAIPIEEIELVHAKLIPGRLPVRIVAGTKPPSQTMVFESIVFKAGKGNVVTSIVSIEIHPILSVVNI